MALLLETIRIEEGKIFNLSYHQIRCDKSRQALFGSHNTLSLASHIQAPPKGLYRCRVLYDTKVRSVEYIPYTPKPIHTLKMVTADIDYSFKYANRDSLDTLLKENNEVDEVIIVKNGKITDTTISNIAFYDKERWLTPDKPLLEGTMRAKLLEEGFLKTASITPKDLCNYTQVALINAMVGFKILNQVTIEDLEGKRYDY
jgi:4-amino-4-deoxychorismate lyase